MRVAVVGKGGSGKTTTASVLARTLAVRGLDVVALDCDTNANLGISLGVGFAATDTLASVRESLDAGDETHAPDPEDLLDRFGADAPDGVRLAVVHKIEHPDPGCPCCGVSPEQILGSVESAGRTVIADFEAGIGTLTRMADGAVDAVVIVVEPAVKSIEVADRALDLARQRGVGRIVVVANRVESEADVERITAALGDVELAMVPEDSAIIDADRAGGAPLDLAPDAPAVRALVELAGRFAGEPVPV